MSSEHAMPLKFLLVLKFHKGILKSRRSLHFLPVHDKSENGLWDGRTFKEGLSRSKLEEAAKLDTLFLFLLILTSLISWRMMPATCSFSLNLCISGSSTVRRFSCAKHTSEVFLRRHFAQFYLSIFSGLPGLAL